MGLAVRQKTWPGDRVPLPIYRLVPEGASAVKGLE